MKASFGSWVIVAGALLSVSCGGSQAAKGANGSGPSGSDGSEPSESAEGAGSESAGESASGPALEIKAPAEGTSALESRNIEMQFDLTLLKDGSPAGMQSGSWSLYEERTLKVLGAQGDAIEKLQVAFGRRETKALLGVEKPSVTAGKTYVVEGGAVKAAGGKDAPGAEQGAVSSEYGWVGSPSPILTMLRDMKPGASAEPSADARRALIGELPGIDHERSKLDVKLVEIGSGARKTAKLEVELESEIDNGDMDFTLKLTGPAQVDVQTGWVTSLDLSGKVTAKGSVKHKKKPMEARGKGTAKISRKAEFGGS